jgi:hypothetical protein
VKTVTQVLEQGHQYDATPALDLNHPFACRQQPVSDGVSQRQTGQLGNA